MKKNILFIVTILIFQINIYSFLFAGDWTENTILFTYSHKPSIVTYQNNVYVTASSLNGDILFKKSSDGGKIWSEEREVCKGPNNSQPNIIIDSNGYIHLVWARSAGIPPKYSILYSKSQDGGKTWSEPKEIVSGIKRIFGFSVATAKGNIYIVWSDFNNPPAKIHFIKSENAGSSWTTPKDIVSQDNSMATSPVISAINNNVYLVWLDERNGLPEIYFKKSKDKGNTWLYDLRLTSVTTNSKNPDIFTEDEKIYVVWIDKQNKNNEVYFKKSDDTGNNWSDELRLTDGSADSDFPAVCKDNNGIYVVWSDRRDKNYKIYFKKSDENESTWSVDFRLANTAENSYSPKICTDSNGVHIIWYDVETFNVFYKRYDLK